MSLLDCALKVFNVDEGNSEVPYKDSEGYWTIGRGHLIGKSLLDLKLSQRLIDEIFKDDLASALRESKLVVGDAFFDSLGRARQVAILSMLYTLGQYKFLKFDETIEAIKREEWDVVADHILASKWARDVDPKQIPDKGRDDRIAYMFRFGRFHPEYGVVE